MVAAHEGTKVTDHTPEDPTRTHEETPTSEVVQRIRIEGRSIWMVIGAILATLVALSMINSASHLLGLVAFSFFLSLALQPLVMRIVHRFGWRRGAAVGVIYVAFIVGAILLVAILIPAIVTLADAIQENAAAWIDSADSWLEDTFGLSFASGSVGSTTGDLGGALDDWATGAAGNLIGFAASGIGLVFDLATIAMFTFYFTADAQRFQRSILGLLPESMQYRVGWTWDQAIVQTGGYFYSRVILMVINGFGFFVTMVIVGVPVTLSIALAAFGGFVAAFIPAIGTYLGSAVPIAVTLALQGLIPALVVLGYALVYQQVENYWLSPKISSNTMSLNGAVAFGGALAGGAIAGPIGAFVALPVAALITAFVSNFAPHSEVVYEFEYDAHVQAAREAAQARKASRQRFSRKKAAVSDG